MAGNASSGRPAKPAVVHLMTGNRSKLAKDKLVTEVAESIATAEAPPMPDWLCEDAQAEWKRVVPDLLKLGLLSPLDMMSLATYCEAMADYQKFRRRIREANEAMDRGDVQTFRTGAKQISVWRQLANDAEKRANSAGAQFGFSPLARRSLRAQTQPQGELFPNEQKEIVDKYF